MGKPLFPIQDLELWIDDALANPEPPWLIQHLVPRQGIVFVSGRPKKEGQKSWFAQGLSLSLATGHSLGPFSVSSSERVWYLDRESPRYFGAQRWRALQRGHSFSQVPGQMDMTHLGLFLLTDERMTDMAAEHIVKTRPALVVVDTLAQSMTGSENDVEHTMKAMRGISKMRDAGAAVMAIHHMRKSACATSGGRPDPDMDVRGSSALVGAWDMHLAIRTYTGNRYLITGGKIAAQRAYTYDWDIQSDADGNAVSARLDSEEIDIDQVEVEEISEKEDRYG